MALSSAGPAPGDGSLRLNRPQRIPRFRTMDPNVAARTSGARHRGLRSDPKTLELAQPPPRFAAAGRCVAPSTAPPSRRPSRPRARHVLWQAAALLLPPEDLLHQPLHVRLLAPPRLARLRGTLL